MWRTSCFRAAIFSVQRRRFSGQVKLLLFFFRNRRRFQQFRVIIPHIPYAITYRPGAHTLGWVRPQQLHRRPLFRLRIEPAIVILRRKNYRHAVVNRLHQLIWVSRQDGEGLERFVVFALPPVPESSECVRLTAFEREGEGVFCLGIDALPLVKSIGRHQAAALLHCVPEGGFGGSLLSSRVDGGVAELWVLCPERDQPPSQEGELAAA